jgi:RNA polymerase sigma factor (sigma-70 family)
VILPALLEKVLTACMKGDRAAQKQLYQSYYGYAMSICLRYAPSSIEAEEIVNDSFLKVFNRLGQYDSSRPFRWWLRRIIINTAIDYYRSDVKNLHSLEAEEAQEINYDQDILSEISVEEILQLIQDLPPAYRLVFNLYVIEGYTHPEIAEKLGIHEGTSRSNLAKARRHLQNKLEENFRNLV